jgi:hypothetical protein
VELVGVEDPCDSMGKDMAVAYKEWSGRRRNCCGGSSTWEVFGEIRPESMVSPRNMSCFAFAGSGFGLRRELSGTQHRKS